MFPFLVQFVAVLWASCQLLMAKLMFLLRDLWTQEKVTSSKEELSAQVHDGNSLNINNWPPATLSLKIDQPAWHTSRIRSLWDTFAVLASARATRQQIRQRRWWRQQPLPWATIVKLVSSWATSTLTCQSRRPTLSPGGQQVMATVNFLSEMTDVNRKTWVCVERLCYCSHLWPSSSLQFHWKHFLETEVWSRMLIPGGGLWRRERRRWASKPTLVSSQRGQTSESIGTCLMTSFHTAASLFFHSGTTLELNAITPVSCLHVKLRSQFWLVDCMLTLATSRSRTKSYDIMMSALQENQPHRTINVATSYVDTPAAQLNSASVSFV